MKGRDTRGRTLQLVYGGLVFFISFGVYLRTLSPTVGFVDSGELTTVAYTLGIAHPTGYPLYTLLSRLFTLIPFGSIAWRVNLASAFFASLAVLFVYLLSKILLDNRTGREGFTATATATATALLFSFSSTLWSQAVVAEVYSLTAFLSSLLLYLVVRFTNNESREGVLRLRRIEPLLFFFIFGLSLGNHMTILTVAIPCVIYLFLKSKAVSGQRPAVSHLTFNILHFSFFILLGLSLYLYLPIRSSQDPILNWGEPKTLTQFFWHISGKQYKVWFLSSSPSVLIQHLQQFLKIWFDQFTPYLLPLCILGIFLLFIKSKGIGLLLLSIFLLNLFYGINYDIPDIDAFFLPLFFITAIWVGGGILIIMSVLPKGFSLLFVLLPLIPMISHFGENDRRKNWIAYDYGMNVLRSIEENGVCITNNWDIYSPVLYIQQIEGKGRDVVMIDKELLRRSWYIHSLKRNYSWLMERSKEEVRAYEEYLKQFESGTLKDPGEIQRRYIKMINSFIEKNIEERPIYTTFINGADRDGPSIGSELLKVPRGLVYQYQSLRETDSIRPWYEDSFSLRGVFQEEVYKDERTILRMKDYPRMAFERGQFLDQRGDFQESLRCFQWILKWDPGNLMSRNYLGYTLLNLGEYDKAREEFQRVLQVDPENGEAMRGVEEATRGAGK